MKKYKVLYWSAGRKKKKEIEALSEREAKLHLYLFFQCDDIISIEEVSENV